MRLWLSVLISSIAVTAAAQQKPDFSGHWSLVNPDDAPSDAARELEVRQSFVAPVTVLTVERRFNGDVRSNTYKVGIEGGTVAGVIGGRGSGSNGPIPHTRFSVKWIGDALEIETGSYSGPTTESAPFSEHKEVWLLDPQGMLLITIADRGTGAEPRTATLTYRRDGSAVTIGLRIPRDVDARPEGRAYVNLLNVVGPSFSSDALKLGRTSGHSGGIVE